MSVALSEIIDLLASRRLPKIKKGLGQLKKQETAWQWVMHELDATFTDIPEFMQAFLDIMDEDEELLEPLLKKSHHLLEPDGDSLPIEYLFHKMPSLASLLDAHNGSTLTYVYAYMSVPEHDCVPVGDLPQEQMAVRFLSNNPWDIVSRSPSLPEIFHVLDSEMDGDLFFQPENWLWANYTSEKDGNALLQTLSRQLGGAECRFIVGSYMKFEGNHNNDETRVVAAVKHWNSIPALRDLASPN